MLDERVNISKIPNTCIKLTHLKLYIQINFKYVFFVTLFLKYVVSCINSFNNQTQI